MTTPTYTPRAGSLASQSVELPQALHGRLSAESNKRNKKAGDTKTWAISRTGADTCRLWRLL